MWIHTTYQLLHLYFITKTAKEEVKQTLISENLWKKNCFSVEITIKIIQTNVLINNLLQLW